MRFLQMRKSFHGQLSARISINSKHDAYTYVDHIRPFVYVELADIQLNTLKWSDNEEKICENLFCGHFSLFGCLNVCCIRASVRENEQKRTHHWPFALRFYSTVMLMLRKWIKFWRAVHFGLNDSMNGHHGYKGRTKGWEYKHKPTMYATQRHFCGFEMWNLSL